MPRRTRRPNAAKLWTEEEEAVLRRLVEDGLGYRVISDRLGRSWIATSKRMAMLGLTTGANGAARIPTRGEARWPAGWPAKD